MVTQLVRAPKDGTMVTQLKRAPMDGEQFKALCEAKKNRFTPCTRHFILHPRDSTWTCTERKDLENTRLYHLHHQLVTQLKRAPKDGTMVTQLRGAPMDGIGTSTTSTYEANVGTFATVFIQNRAMPGTLFYMSRSHGNCLEGQTELELCEAEYAFT